MELISLNKTLYPHYLKFHHYLRWLVAKMAYDGRQHTPTLRSLFVPSKGWERKYRTEKELG
jgi:hypothetical protein